MSRVAAPRDARGRFVNWAGTVVSHPSRWREPEGEPEVAELVRAAAREGQRVRVVGAGHSWSAIAAPEQVAVTLDRCVGVASLDRARGLAVVRAGTRLKHLNAALAAVGFALPIVGSVAEQSIAGAIATGTHGSSLAHGNLASLVTAMRVVSGEGELVELPEGDARLAGARVNLGALGVVTEVTLRVEPAFRLAETVERLPLARLVGRLTELARSAEYVKVWWLPHVPYAHVFRYERTGEASTTRPSPATQRWIDERVMHAAIFPALTAAQRAAPWMIPATNRLVAATLPSARRVGPSALMLSTPNPLRHRETECALALSRCDEALDRLVSLVTREEIGANFPLELRFVRGDDGWLSPASGGDVCQIGAYSTQLADTERFFRGFWREMRALEARPHWGKEFDHARDELAVRYASLPRFLALRDALDPGRVFGSAMLTRVLGG